MNKKVKNLWVKALTSGKYKQTQNVLKRRNGACCCLGVLCELAVKEGVIPKPVYIADDTCYVYGSDSDKSNERLPKAVRQWAGLGENENVHKFDYKDNKNVGFTWLNDELDATFVDIAKLIKKKM